MKTELALDPTLVEKAFQVSGARTREAAVTLALEAFIACREQSRLIDVFGTVEIDPQYDPKPERSRR